MVKWMMRIILESMNETVKPLRDYDRKRRSLLFMYSFVTANGREMLARLHGVLKKRRRIKCVMTEKDIISVPRAVKRLPQDTNEFIKRAFGNTKKHVLNVQTENKLAGERKKEGGLELLVFFLYLTDNIFLEVL